MFSCVRPEEVEAEGVFMQGTPGRGKAEKGADPDASSDPVPPPKTSHLISPSNTPGHRPAAGSHVGALLLQALSSIFA